MKKMLEGKRILFFSPAFFDYEKQIAQKMENMGAEVVFYDERSVTSAFARALLKVCPILFAQQSDRYYRKIVEAQKGGNFDFVFVIKGDMISKSTVQLLRNTFTDAMFCLYLWDSVDNAPQVEKIFSMFDYVGTFDRFDSVKYGIAFRPLFFSEDFIRSEQKDDYEYDIAFCGTIHSDRLNVLKKVEMQCSAAGLRYYKFYYLQSSFIYWFYKIVNPEFRNVEMSYFDFVKKSQKELSDIENNTKVIIDIQHPKQSGLTMRTLEILGLNKKLITTNQDIVNYDFYDASNICVIDRNNPKIDIEFVSKPYVKISDDVCKKYSIGSWIVDIFGIGSKV